MRSAMLAPPCFALPAFASRPIGPGAGYPIRANVPSSIGLLPLLIECSSHLCRETNVVSSSSERIVGESADRSGADRLQANQPDGVSILVGDERHDSASERFC